VTEPDGALRRPRSSGDAAPAFPAFSQRTAEYGAVGHASFWGGF